MISSVAYVSATSSDKDRQDAEDGKTIQYDLQIILDPPVRGALAARAVLRARPLLHLHLQRAERRDPVAVAPPRRSA
jgi:hypothetical protein